MGSVVAHGRSRALLFSAVVSLAAGLVPTPSNAPIVSVRHVLRPDNVLMKDWSRRETLAEKSGGAADVGAAAVGLTGTIPVVFKQGNDTISTMATLGQPLSAVAAQAGQYIKYKCRKGECGTCAVQVDGQWIRTCTVTVPYVPKGESYEVFVRGTMLKPTKSSRFFSFTSFIAGFRNNLLGMVGFVKEGPLSRKGKENFKDRINTERELAAKVAARKAARAAAGEGKDSFKAR